MDILGPAKTSRVFIVQDQYMRHPENNSLVSKFDFSQAVRYGELVFLLEPDANPFRPNEDVISALTDQLYDFNTMDFLLLTGNPVLIGWATAIAAQMSKGSVRFLQWNGRRKCYLEVAANNLFQFV